MLPIRLGGCLFNLIRPSFFFVRAPFCCDAVLLRRLRCGASIPPSPLLPLWESAGAPKRLVLILACFFRVLRSVVW